MGHASDFFSVAKTICETISYEQIDNLAEQLVALRDRKGRLFLIGVGGSAANCSHAVNDFKKLCSIRAFTPLDNVAELTARINDEGWDTVFANWLQEVGLNDDDALLILSVGGGSLIRQVSSNIVKAIDFATTCGAQVFGIVGKDDGYTALNGDLVVVVPEVSPAWVTPLSEAFQALVWHCLVSHSLLQTKPTKW